MYPMKFSRIPVVAQICPPCLAERVKSAGRKTGLTSTGGFGLAAAAITATILGAFAWVCLWRLEAWLFAKVSPADTGVVQVPHMYLVVVFLIIGCSLGALVGKIVAIAPNRGRRFGCFMACLAALIAGVLGEAITITWFAKDAGQSVSFLEAVIMVPLYWLVTRMEGACHMLAIVAMMIVAWYLARPPRESYITE